MSIAEWPSTIPDSPLLEDYNRTTQPSRVISNVGAGANKMRGRFRATPRPVTEVFVMKDSEREIFENFYQNDINGGAERFLKQDPVTGLVKEYRFRESEPEIDNIGYDNNGPVWRILTEMEIMP